MKADLTSQHIEGYAALDIDQRFFSVPLISQITDNLWTGGCIEGVPLPDDFTFVMSLYPWEQYKLGPNTVRREVKLYDCTDMPNEDQIFEIAREVNEELSKPNAKVLVHCQAGLNRSGLIAATALILTGVPPKDAIAMLREKRSEVVLCNPSFERWLLGSK